MSYNIYNNVGNKKDQERSLSWTSKKSHLPQNGHPSRKKATTAFFEYGEWWDGPLHEWAWPEGMIVAWQPMPAPYTGKRNHLSRYGINHSRTEAAEGTKRLSA